MQIGSNVSFDGESNGTDCAFCNYTEISHILKETPNFLLAADHAPLVEGHILIIPKQHFACYGAVPAEFDAELEHGIFRQTVFHAHLHCFPFGTTGYDLDEQLHNLVVTSQEDIRKWYAAHGPYFYMEDAISALLFAPEMERYLGIVRNLFLRGIASRGGKIEWRSPQQRYEEGASLIETMIEKWRSFQQQEAEQHDSLKNEIAQF